MIHIHDWQAWIYKLIYYTVAELTLPSEQTKQNQIGEDNNERKESYK